MDIETPIRDYFNNHSKYNINHKDTWNSRLIFVSDQMYKDLEEKFGIGPRKSLTYTATTKLINHDLFSHFLRGYNDGDGSFYFATKNNANGNKNLLLSICGTQKFLTPVQNKLRKECDIDHTNKIHFHNNQGHLKYGGNLIVGRIVKYLYKNANIYLERKYNIIKNYL